jgi:hypothetical protein
VVRGGGERPILARRGQAALPLAYLETFAEPGSPPGEPAVWMRGSASTDWARVPLRGGAASPLDEPGAARPHPAWDLDSALGPAAAEAAGVVARRSSRPALVPRDRELLARLGALLAVRLQPRFAELAESEAREGVRALAAMLGEMGWVFWEAREPDFFVTSSAPLALVVPSPGEGLLAEADPLSPAAEVTLPLAPRLALHATWALRGEAWRVAGEEVVAEVNARTALRARRFLAAPHPAVPGWRWI